MPAARYWRFSSFDTYGGGELVLTELALYEAGVRVDTSAVVTSALDPTTGSIDALSDGSNAVACSWSTLRRSSPAFSLVYDLGSAKLLDEVRFGSGAGQAGFPFRVGIQSSDDGLAWGSVFMASDVPYPGPFANASLRGDMSVGYASQFILKFEGANNSTTFTDTGLSPITMTPVGDVKISTAQVKFGTSSGYFDGNGDYLTLSRLPLSSKPFTIAAWVWLNANPVVPPGNAAYGGSTIVSQCVNGANGEQSFGFSAGNQLFLDLRRGTTVGQFSATDVTPAETWTHVAATFDGTTSRLFVGGALQANTVARGWGDVGTPFYVGQQLIPLYPMNKRYFNGYIRDLHILDGLALWTSSFTPPTETLKDYIGFTSGAAPVRAMFAAPPQLASPYTPPAFGAKFNPMVKARHRLDWQGDGFITATVKQKGEPANVPVRRKVLCMDMAANVVVDETWSDAVTGEYTFRYLDRSRQYTVISYDHKLAYRATIADSLTPEKMP